MTKVIYRTLEQGIAEDAGKVKNRITNQKVQYGDFVKEQGLMYGHEKVIGEKLLMMKEQMEKFLIDNGHNIDDFIVEYVVKLSWENTNGLIGNTRLDDNAVPYYSVGWKAARKE